MKSKNAFIFIIIILLAATFKIVLLLTDAFPFNSDEAIVGLMARHILDGERPIFYYGQAYMGSFDAWLVSAGFAIFGTKIWVIRAIQILLYLCTITLSMLIVSKVSQSKLAVIVTGILLAFPTVNMTLYTTVSLGGYGESLLIGSILLLLFLIYPKVEISYRSKALLTFSIGILAGFGFWVNSLTLVYSIPVFVLLIYQWFRWKNVGFQFCKIFKLSLTMMVGLIAGMTPWIYFIFQSGWHTAIGEIFGSAVAVGNRNFLISIAEHLRNLILFGSTVIFGIRPPWGIQILAEALMIPAMLVWMLIIYFGLRKSVINSNKIFWKLVASVCMVLFFGFLLTPFGNDPSGRYFLPIYHMMAIGAGIVLAALKLKFGYKLVGIAMLVIFNTWGTVQCAIINPPGLTTQFDVVAQIDHSYDEELIRFLEDKEEFYGYSNYWIAYPLAFRSDEKLIFVPALPYHLDFRYTKRDNRYEPYNELVSSSQKIAYITTKYPSLDERIRNRLKQLNIQWREEKIGDYQIFYQLSKRVNLYELELQLVE